MAPLDPEGIGGPGDVAVVGAELGHDVGPLEGLARLLEGALPLAVLARPLLGAKGGGAGPRAR